MPNKKNAKTVCYECKERHENCHATCEKYIQWRKAFDIRKNIINREKKKQNERRWKEDNF